MSAVSGSLLDPMLYLVGHPRHPASSKRYPLGELAASFEPRNVSEAVGNAIDRFEFLLRYELPLHHKSLMKGTSQRPVSPGQGRAKIQIVDATTCTWLRIAPHLILRVGVRRGRTPTERRAWRDGIYTVIKAMMASGLQGKIGIERRCRLAGVSCAGYCRYWQASPRHEETDLRDAIRRLVLANHLSFIHASHQPSLISSASPALILRTPFVALRQSRARRSSPGGRARARATRSRSAA